MSKQDHLKDITPDLLLIFKTKLAFCPFASASGNNGLVQIGVDGNGIYNVRVKHKSGNNTIYYFTTPSEAINKYSELIT